MKKIFIYFAIIGAFLLSILPIPIKAAEAKCSYYIDSQHGYKPATQADANLAGGDTDGTQAPYLLEKGYRLSFWGGSTTQNCVIDLTNVTVNGGSITANGPGQSITVIGDGDDVFDGRIYMEAGNYVFKNIKFKRTQATTEDPGITININEYDGAGGSSYYFDENTEIITGDFIPSGQARQAIQVGGLRANSQVIFDGKITMESGGIGVTSFSSNKNSDMLDNANIIFNGTLQMGPSSMAGFYIDGKNSNLTLSENSSVTNPSSAPVFSLQNNTTMNSLNLLGSIQSNSIMREGTFTAGAIDTINFGGPITANTPGTSGLVALYSDQININNMNFLDTFSITSDFDYLLAKSPAKGNSTIQNIMFNPGSVVDANTAVYVGKGAIENVTFNGNKATDTVLEVNSGARVGTATLDEMHYNNDQAIIINNKGTIDHLSIGQNSLNNQFIVNRLIKNEGAGAFINKADINAFVVTDPTLFDASATHDANAYSIENSDLSQSQIKNLSLTQTFLFGPTRQVNEGNIAYQQIQPTAIEVNVVDQQAGSMTINAKALGVATDANLSYVVLDENHQPVSTVFSATQDVTFTTQPNKNYTVANYAKMDATSSIIYSSTASNVMAAATEYTVTFDVNGGEGQAIAPQIYIQGQAITQPTQPIKTGYHFVGWNENANGTGNTWDFTNDVMPANDLTLYAQYAPNQYQVTFDANGGKGSMAKETYTFDETKALFKNTFTKDGYTFLGWSTTPTGAVERTDQMTYLYDQTSDMTLYAQWQADGAVINNETPSHDLTKTGDTSHAVLIGSLLSLAGVLILLVRKSSQSN